jgi:hypothetical protein
MTQRLPSGAIPTHPLTPSEVARLRNQITLTVREILPQARRVVLGERHWTTVQLGVFRTLLAKVLPDLNQAFGQIQVAARPLTQLSRAELEAIARGEDASIQIEVEAADIEVSAALSEVPDPSLSADEDQRLVED